MISFRQLCQMGLRCPYHSSDECGDEVCSFPYTRDYCPEGDELALIHGIGECPLLDYESELYAALSAYLDYRMRIDASCTPLRQPQTDLTSYNASADALQTQSQIITKEDQS